jgi:methionyl-tRNA formyltransferase
MRIVFLTHRFSRTGAVSLQHLHRQGLDIVAVVTPTVGYKGRGIGGSLRRLIRRRGMWFSALTVGRGLVTMARIAVARACGGSPRWLGLPWSVDEVRLDGATIRLSPEDVNAPSFVDAMAKLDAELLVICISDRVVREPLLARIRRGGINLHPAPLPRYRGPDPLYWQLVQGETCSAITVHEVTQVVDGGDILVQECFQLDADETERSFKRKIDERAPGVLMRAIEMVRGGITSPVRQDHAAATYFPERPKTWRHSIRTSS